MPAKPTTDISVAEQPVAEQSRESEQLGESEQSGESEQTAPENGREYGGPKGKEPTRYGDWEKNGRCIDF
jgi:hypothetical protein